MCLAIPGEILSIDEEASLTREGGVAFAGIVKRISLAFVPEAGIGDFVIVHAGFAIAKLDRQEAERTLAMLQPASEGPGS